MRTSKNLYSVEKLLLIVALLTLALYQLIGIPLRVPWFLYQRKVAFGVATYLLGKLIQVLIFRLQDIKAFRADGKKRDWKNTLKNYKELALVKSLLIIELRLVHSIGLMFVIYINLKHLIPYINPKIFDPVIADWERRLFSGIDPASWLISKLTTESAPALSSVYMFFYPYIAFLTTSMIIFAEKNRAKAFCCSFVFMWFFAILWEYSFPTLGPCFSTPELFTSLPFTEVREIQTELWRQKLYLDRYPRGEWGVFLISGQPSLHLAAIIHGSLHLAKLNRYTSFASWTLAILTSVATIYFGWHFLTDLFGSIILVLSTNWICSKIFHCCKFIEEKYKHVGNR